MTVERAAEILYVAHRSYDGATSYGPSWATALDQGRWRATARAILDALGK